MIPCKKHAPQSTEDFHPKRALSPTRGREGLITPPAALQSTTFAVENNSTDNTPPRILILRPRITSGASKPYTVRLRGEVKHKICYDYIHIQPS